MVEESTVLSNEANRKRIQLSRILNENGRDVDHDLPGGSTEGRHMMRPDRSWFDGR